jgi:DNA-directed RNA polymerase specialized sigma24 family protein
VKSRWGKEEFEKFLSWLDPDRDRAALKHEEVRRRLIRFFECRGCPIAEELADESIDRVIIKIDELAETYVGERIRYFYGVARKVYLESVHRPAASIPPVLADPPDETTPEYIRLEECLDRLPQKDRDLIVEYYEEDKQAKINHRKALADRLGISGSTLRLRAHRIRAMLEDCIISALALSVGHP